MEDSLLLPSPEDGESLAGDGVACLGDSGVAGGGTLCHGLLFDSFSIVPTPCSALLKITSLLTTSFLVSGL